MSNKVIYPNDAFNARVDSFLIGLNGKIAAEYAKRFSMLEVPVCYADPGNRYIKIVREGHGSKSVHCFIDKTNGDVLKAASWHAPAKHPRSNINDSDYGLSGVNEYGANYLH